MSDGGKPEAGSAVLSFDPLRQLTRKGALLATDADEASIFSEPEPPVLHAMLVRPERGVPGLDVAKTLIGAEGDPFRPGAHFIERPVTDKHGSFDFTLLFALALKDAEEILDASASPAQRSQIVSTTFRVDEDGQQYIPVGYGTLSGSFRSQAEVLKEMGEEDEPVDPGCYLLYLHPDSFFLSVLFRGCKLGVMSGAALARPIADELCHLADESICLGVETRVEISTYFEIYSEGGEAAVDSFHECLEFTMETFDEINSGDCGLVITSIEPDGGW